MKLIGEKGFLELEPSEIGERGTPGEGDILLNVAVKAWSYSAADHSWVMAGDWDRFLLELKALDERRQGRAVLGGSSPDDLRLEFYSTDSVGHMAVRGHLGRHRFDGHFLQLLQLRFGFSFEPDRLPGVVQALRSFRT
jgi:hypothetical protein